MAKYTLKAQSVMVLKQILAIPGWAKSIEDIYRGGKILAAVLPELKEGTKAVEPVEFEMDGPDRDACKTALNFALSKEAVQASVWVVDICETLEFVPKPKVESL